MTLKDFVSLVAGLINLASATVMILWSVDVVELSGGEIAATFLSMVVTLFRVWAWAVRR